MRRHTALREVWESGWSNGARLTYLFLVFHPSMSAVGAMVEPFASLALDLGMASHAGEGSGHRQSKKDIALFLGALRELEAMDAIRTDPESDLLVLPGWITYFPPASPNAAKSLQKVLDGLPYGRLLQSHWRACKAFVSSIGPGFARAVDGIEVREIALSKRPHIGFVQVGRLKYYRTLRLRMAGVPARSKAYDFRPVTAAAPDTGPDPTAPSSIDRAHARQDLTLRSGSGILDPDGVRESFDKRGRVQGKGERLLASGSDASKIKATPNGFLPFPDNPCEPLILDDSERLKAVLRDWNETAKASGFRTAHKLSETRRKHLRARLTDPGWAESYTEALRVIRGEKWMTGWNDRNWVANLDWFLRPDTVLRILEGAYTPRRKGYGESHTDSRSAF